MKTTRTEEYYLSFWTDVREKLLLAARLDPPMKNKLDLYRKPSRLIFGASFHNYQFDPMHENDIQALEDKLGILFPLNFRTYLKVCGMNSAGPGYGINNKRITRNSLENRKVVSPLIARTGMGLALDLDDDEDGSDLSENEYNFMTNDIYSGTIEISTSGNPCTHHLVVNGKTQGNVFSYTVDMLFYEHSFEVWYMKWLDKTLDELQSGRAKEYFEKSYVPRAQEPENTLHPLIDIPLTYLVKLLMWLKWIK